ncbi:MAG: arylsulfatase [Kiritimatiellae bacterium]|nr:arylsulfatase [Kiritimatiellia bacterium]
MTAAPSTPRVRALVILALLVCGAAVSSPPNFVLIVADDLGFSDPGFMGGEIETPVLDALAAGGLRFVQFYNSARCCPTRAALLTGLHPHQTGIGWMTIASEEPAAPDEPPAYQGFLNDRCVTIAEVLRAHGYTTLMTGKWHLGRHRRDVWPLQRGFDRFYGCLDGALRYFQPEHPRGIMLDNDPVAHPHSTTEREFYTTDAFTDWAIRFLREGPLRTSQPFFLYLAYTAPHWPLQAFEDLIAKYWDRYRLGWDHVREERWRRQQAAGLWPPGTRSPPRPAEIPAWDSLPADRRDEMALKMAVYAAMVDRMDWNIGRLVECLKTSGVYSNTVILFMSDNGACAEGGMFGRGEFRDVTKRNREFANAYGEAWAWACNTPLRLYKRYLHEGGSASPFVVHWPAGLRPQAEWCREPASVLYILPTLLDLAGAVYPRERRGVPLPPPEGISLRPLLEGRPLQRVARIAFEHEGNASLRDGVWKLVGRDLVQPAGLAAERWELYRIGEDPTETLDLARAEPERLRAMHALWMDWAHRVGVWPKGDRGPLPSRVPHAPQVAGRTLGVDLEVESPAPRGVVLSHGGTNLGWAVYFDAESRPCFAVRHRGRLHELRADRPVRGHLSVRAELTATTLTLRVQGTTAATAPSPGPLPAEPAAGLHVGEGPQPIGSYVPPFRFRGWVHRWDVVAEPAPGTAPSR